MRYFLFLLIFISALFFVGCNPAKEVEEKFFIPDSIPVDYLLEANKVSTAVMQELQGYKSRHLNILRGEYPREEELVALEKSIDEAQKRIEDFTALRAPAVYDEHQKDMIKSLNDYRESLIKYKAALQGGEEKSIRTAAAGLSAQFSVIAGLFLVK